MSRGGNSARGLAGSYAAGRNRVDEIIADGRRFTFAEKLFKATCTYGFKLETQMEQEFLQRIIAETNPKVPNLHPGDRNIIDSLRRRYESKLP